MLGLFQERLSARDFLLCLGHLPLELRTQEPLLVQIPPMLAELADNNDRSDHDNQTEQGAEDDRDQLRICQRLLFDGFRCLLRLSAVFLSFDTFNHWLLFDTFCLDKNGLK